MPRTRYLAAICLGMMSAMNAPERDHFPIGALIITLLTLCFIVVAHYRPHFTRPFLQAAFILILFTISGAYALWRTDLALRQQWSISPHPRAQTLDITITGLPHTDPAQHTHFTAIAAANGQNYHLLLHDFTARSWQIGSRWRIQARVRAPVSPHNIAGKNNEAWALANGIDGIGNISGERYRLPEDSSPRHFIDHVRAQLGERWQRTATETPHGAALMRALTIGDQSGLSPETWLALRPLGVQHLISISGLHVSMFALWIALLMRQIFRRTRITPPNPRTWILLSGCLAATIYTTLAGAHVPALRSLLMMATFAWFWWRNGRISVWQAWWLAMLGVLILQPASMLTAGFWLSFGLTGAILWANTARANAPLHTRQARFFHALNTQWAATLLGGIATIFLFGLLPVFSPLVNAVAIPWFSWILVPLGLIAMVQPFETPVIWVAHLAQWSMDALIFLGKMLPEVAFAQPPLPLFIAAIAAGLCLLLPRGGGLKPLSCCILALFLGYTPPSSGSLKANILDVGQGLAIVFQTPNHTILFDTGTPAADAILLPTLRAMGITHIDELIVSHHDNDHDGGYERLAQSISIGRIWAGQPEFYAGARDCRGVMPWEYDGARFEILTLDRDPNERNDNAHSCILRVWHNHHAMLITGDIGAAQEKQLSAHYGAALRSDVLILAHHGSRFSNTSAFINAVAPRIAVSSSGFANPFKHPHPDTQNRLRAHRVQLWRTDLQGSITVSWQPEGLAISTLSRRFWWQKKPIVLQ